LGFGIWNELVGEMLAFLYAMFRGLPSSSISSTSTEQAFAFLGGGAAVAFFFGLGFSVCPLQLFNSGMVFEGSISATCEEPTCLSTFKSDPNISYLIITDFHDITVIIVARRSSKVIIIYISINLIHSGSLALNRSLGLAKLRGAPAR